MTAIDERQAAAPARPDRMQAALLALSAERDAALRRQLEAERRAYERGRADEHEAAFAAGWAACEADLAAVLRGAVRRPEEGWQQRVQAAEAGCRRDAAEHERAFVARAYATAPADRTPPQAATVQAYPPGFGRQR